LLCADGSGTSLEIALHVGKELIEKTKGFQPVETATEEAGRISFAVEPEKRGLMNKK
jgi:hypothetical protein